jgi:ClpX C4-type zinc finger protein
MRCFEVWLNGKRVALVGHPEAERISATLEATKEIDPVSLELLAELPAQAGSFAYASWESHDLVVGDKLELQVIDDDHPDVGSVIKHGVGELVSDDAKVWPLCSLCGKSYHDVHAMIRGQRAYVCDLCIDTIVKLWRE